MDVIVIGYIITIILEGRRIKGQKPESVDTQVLQVIQFLSQTDEVTYAVCIAVFKRADMQFIDNGILIPQRVIFNWKDIGVFSHSQYLVTH